MPGKHDSGKNNDNKPTKRGGDGQGPTPKHGGKESPDEDNKSDGKKR